MKRLSLLTLLVCGFFCAACGSGTSSDGRAPASLLSGREVSDDISNKNITSFAEDGNGYIWLGTIRGLNRFNSYSYIQFFCTGEDRNIPSNHVTSLLCDSGGRLWVGTATGICWYGPNGDFRQTPIKDDNKFVRQLVETRGGRILMNNLVNVCAYNPETEEFEIVLTDIDPGLSTNVRIHVDGNDALWVVNQGSLRCYDSETMTLLDSVAISGSPSYSRLLENGELWLAGPTSIQILDVNTRELHPAPAAVSDSPLLANNHINCIEPYGDGLLLSTDRQGLLYYNKEEEVVVSSNEAGFPFDAPDFAISVMFTDSQGNLWLGSDDQGYEVRSSTMRRFNSNYRLRLAFKGKSVVNLQKGREGRLWVVTRSDGLWLYDGGTSTVRQIPLPTQLRVNGYEPNIDYVFVDEIEDLWLITENSTVTHCSFDGSRLAVEETFSLQGAKYMVQDENNVMWVSTDGRYVFVKGPRETKFEMVEISAPAYTFIPCMLPLSDGSIMLAAYNQPLRRLSPAARSVADIPISAEDYASIFSQYVMIPVSLFEDSAGDVWIGTRGNGLLRYSPSDNSLTPVRGTSCKDICGVEEDGEGNIWVSTLFGLCKYDRGAGSFTNWYAMDGIGGNQFNDRASCVLDDGTLVFGGTHGLTIFDPEDLNHRENVPLVFEDLRVFGRHVPPSENGCIDKILALRPDIHIRHDQNEFSISFSALKYSRFRHLRYSYKMDGFDDYWRESNSATEAYYSKLPAGKYTFRVRVSDNGRSIVETESSIRVIVHPAPWSSWWAWCTYVLLLLGVMAVIALVSHRWNKEREALRMSQMEKEHERMVNRMNMNFFANVSHEFRIPLSVISGPVEQLCGDSGIQGGNRDLLEMVRKGVQRMLRLVNQLLDFNRLEDDALGLKVRNGDIAALLRGLLDNFGVMAEEKGISLTSCGLETPFLMYIDDDKIYKIFENLLSNALKFTPAGGSVEVGLGVASRSSVIGQFKLREGDVEEQYVKISVTDTGCGIPEDELEKVFERYYQLENNTVGKYNYGSGIGLYYARRVAELHHGYLKAFNREDGIDGSVFVLLLPVSGDCYSEAEFDRAEETAQDRLFPLQTGGVSKSDESGADRPAILVVDDDVDVVHYLKILLGDKYRVLECFDADSALRLMEKDEPDIVVSDIAMPGKDGYELCREIKQSLNLCHIPVILLTAKVTVDDQVQGLDSGADAYVTKPFDPTLLLALLDNQLKGREKLRNILHGITKGDELEDNMLSPQDKAFMEDLYGLMEDELKNSELNVNRMAESLHISRTKIYYKVKSLTGESPSNFFKTYKLNRAAELLKEGRYNISEIADITGFSTLSHFSTSFKKRFGVPPSEYLG